VVLVSVLVVFVSVFVSVLVDAPPALVVLAVAPPESEASPVPVAVPPESEVAPPVAVAPPEFPEVEPPPVELSVVVSAAFEPPLAVAPPAPLLVAFAGPLASLSEPAPFVLVTGPPAPDDPSSKKSCCDSPHARASKQRVSRLRLGCERIVDESNHPCGPSTTLGSLG
jgi:hypothetical protein